MRMSYILLCLLALSLTNAFAPLHLTENSVPDSYIVAFHSTVSSDTLTADLEAIRVAHNITYKYTYSHTIKGFAAKLNKEQLTAVKSHPRVEYIEQDQVVHANCFTASGATWGISRVSHRKFLANGAFSAQNNLGEGVNIYVIDTGINLLHQDFQGRATFGFNAMKSWPSQDDNGHGTHVASTAGGVTYGIAKKASLIHVKVLDADGSGTTSGVIAGIEYAVEEHKTRGKPSVANLSLGGGTSDLLDAAINSASSSGVIMVVAAGNSNVDACTSSPARATGAITVGATDIGTDPNGNQADVRSYFSNFGKCTAIFAPGSSITAAWVGSTEATNTISGTSMASPHVAGATAVLLGQQPGLSFAEVKKALQGTATLDVINMQCAKSGCDASPNLMLYSGCTA